jgi:corrinoid protein of di/trimethylamine methyltransferase
MKQEAIMQKVADAVVRGEKQPCIDAVNEALKAGMKPYDILMEGCKKGMDIVGEKYQNHKMYLPEVLSAAAAMYGAIDVLKPLMAGSKNVQSPGTVVIGVAEGDVHDIGKNIVRILLDGMAYQVHDLGRDVQLDRFIDTAKREKADVIACSTLMTTTLASIEDLMNMMREEGLKGKVSTIIGGAATNQTFADDVHADAWGADASDGINKIGEMVKKRRGAT